MRRIKAKALERQAAWLVADTGSVTRLTRELGNEKAGQAFWDLREAREGRPAPDTSFGDFTRKRPESVR